MGSDAHLIIVGGDDDTLIRAIARIEELESRWSRFRPDSEVSALNAVPGRPVPVSADTRLLVARAVEAWRLTGGSFDPTLLDDLLRVGYDRSFEQLNDSSDLREVLCPTPNRVRRGLHRHRRGRLHRHPPDRAGVRRRRDRQGAGPPTSSRPS
jgi:thiamine biosynthesis lipoprotein